VVLFQKDVALRGLELPAAGAPIAAPLTTHGSGFWNRATGGADFSDGE
jgi:hypothetical protein